jgi:hypothetical protein
MQTFDQHLTALVNAEEITFEVAKAQATNPADFELNFRMSRGSKALTPLATSAVSATSPMGVPAAPAMTAPAPAGAVAGKPGDALPSGFEGGNIFDMFTG